MCVFPVSTKCSIVCAYKIKYSIVCACKTECTCTSCTLTAASKWFMCMCSTVCAGQSARGSSHTCYRTSTYSSSFKFCPSIITTCICLWICAFVYGLMVWSTTHFLIQFRRKKKTPKSTTKEEQVTSSACSWIPGD